MRSMRLPKTLFVIKLLLLSLIASISAEISSDPTANENDVTLLTAGVEFNANVDGQEHTYFRYSHKGADSFFVYLFPCTGNPDLFINEGHLLPSLHSHTYFSINGRGVDYVEMPLGVSEISIAVYGMTESRFSMLISTKPLGKVTIANRQVKAYSISSDRVSLMWLPASGRWLVDAELDALSGSTASLEQRLDAAITEYSVYSILEGEEDDPSRDGGLDSSLAFRPRETLLDTPCGMVAFGRREGEGSLQTRQESRFMYFEVRNLLPGREYTFNVRAAGRRNGFFDAAYVPIRIRTERFDEMKLDKAISSYVEKGKYRHFKLAVKRSEVALSQRDNFFRDEELTMRFKLLSAAGGDADLYIALNAGPATFSSCDYSAEALSVDVIDIPITETYTTFYVGVYGKEDTEFSLNAESLRPQDLVASSQKETEESSGLSGTVQILLQILEVILEILS